MFLTSQLWATLHPKIKPSKPKLCLKMASWTPQEGPRRAQDSPRWGQDGPKKGRRVPSKSRKIIPEALLGPSRGQTWPSRAHLGPFQPRLKSSCRHNCCLSAFNGTSQPVKDNVASLSRLLLDLRWQCRPQQPTHQRTNAQTHKLTGLVRQNARSD